MFLDANSRRLRIAFSETPRKLASTHLKLFKYTVVMLLSRIDVRALIARQLHRTSVMSHVYDMRWMLSPLVVYSSSRLGAPKAYDPVSSPWCLSLKRWDSLDTPAAYGLLSVIVFPFPTQSSTMWTCASVLSSFSRSASWCVAEFGPALGGFLRPSHCI